MRKDVEGITLTGKELKVLRNLLNGLELLSP
jgi:hypothetical protein